MQKNRLYQGLLLFVIVICTLLLSSLIPEFSFGALSFKRINLLEDIQPKPEVVIKKSEDKTPIEKERKKRKFKHEPCKPGMTCLEDYSKDQTALDQFFESLYDTDTKPIRIAYFGDSFIEGDILTSSFRDTLQWLFGGQGVGYMPAASEVSQFRTTIQHTYRNWQIYSMVGRKNAWSPLSTTGYCFVPKADNEIIFRIPKKKSIPFKNIRLFYSNPLNASLEYTLNDSVTLTQKLTSSKKLEQVSLNAATVKSLTLKFTDIDSLKVYGFSFEEPAGLYVDNLAMRGNSGTGLIQITHEMNEQFNSFQDYKLIVLQYGLNAVNENDSLGYHWYIDRMIKVVNRLKEDFPKSSILLISVSDRGSNQGGTFKTIPAIPRMRDAQRRIAQTCEIAFWDLYNAMGGENSMVKYVNAVPPMASKDYTHFTFRGGKKIAKQLADALLFERKQYAQSQSIRP